MLDVEAAVARVHFVERNLVDRTAGAFNLSLAPGRTSGRLVGKGRGGGKVQQTSNLQADPSKQGPQKEQRRPPINRITEPVTVRKVS